MKLKTAASIIVTSISFLSFPLPSKKTSQNHQSTLLETLKFYIYV